MRYFINKSDYLGYVDVSQNIEEKYLEPAWRLAQIIDIKNAMCEALYNEFYTQFDSGTLSYANAALLPYVKDAMIFVSYHRFLSTSAQIKNTPFGLVKKLSQDSEPATRTEVSDMINMAKSDANHFMGELMKYLKDNNLNSACNDGCDSGPDYGGFNITRA